MTKNPTLTVNVFVLGTVAAMGVDCYRELRRIYLPRTRMNRELLVYLSTLVAWIITQPQ